jgi:hypothetical protein
MRSTSRSCQLNKPPFFQCCCQCKFHIPDHYRHSDRLHKKGLCYKQKGWICDPQHEGIGATSGWPEHSVGCELFTPINRRDYKKHMLFHKDGFDKWLEELHNKEVARK